MKSFVQFIKESKDIQSVVSLVSKVEATISAFKELHWNLNGDGFLRIHELFGEIYDELGEYQDRIAEKARVMGSGVKLSPNPIDISKFTVEAALTYAKDILEDLSDSVNSVASSFSDPSLENILGEFSEQIDSFIYKVTSSME